MCSFVYGIDKNPLCGGGVAIVRRRDAKKEIFEINRLN